MTYTTTDQEFFENVLQKIDCAKIDALALLQLEIKCRQIKSFPEFCNTLAVERWSEPIRVEMLQWQKALGLSNEDFYFVMNLPLTKQLTTALRTQNLS